MLEKKASKTLIKVDRNGTKYYKVVKPCPKCGGEGYIHYYNHVQGGVCFLCGGEKWIEETVKEYTPEYEAKLNKRRVKRAAEKRMQKILKNFPELKAYFVLGETFNIKEELKAKGAKWDYINRKWYFNKKVDGYNLQEIDVNEDTYNDTVEIFKEITFEVVESESKYVGNINDKIEISAKLKLVSHYETHFGTTYIFVFIDKQNNLFVWKTSKLLKEINVGDKVEVKGTIKEHSEYNHEKQTILTRCKVKVA